MDDTKASLLLSRRMPGGAQDVFSSICNRFRFAPPSIIKQALDMLGTFANEHGRIPAATLYKVLEDHDLALNEYEQSYVNKRFGFNETLLLPKFIESLDVLPPKTHAEPEAFHDNLPQPYRMISKIIELDILDPAWLEITRLHPDILLNSDGKPLMIPRNNNFKNIAPAAVVYDSDSLSNIVSMKSGVGQFISSVIKSNNKIDESNVEVLYKFALLDSNSDKIANSITIITESEGLKVQCNPWIVSTTMSSFQTETSEVICSRVCIGAIVMKKEKFVSTEPPKKGAPVEEFKTILMTKTIIVDVFWCNLNVQSMKAEVQTRVTLDLDRPLFNTTLSEPDKLHLYKMNACLDICDGGEMYLYSSGSVCEIYKIIASEVVYANFVAPDKLKPVISSTINEHDAPVVTAPTEPKAPEVPTYSLMLTIDNSTFAALAARNIMSAKFAMQSYNVSKSNPANPSAGILPYSVCILLENALEWFMVSFEKVVNIVPDAPPVEAPPAKGAAAAKKGAAPVVEAPKEVTVPKFNIEEKYFFFLSGKWKLSSPITSHYVDDNQSVLALGHQNGLVTLWDISSRQYISSISHHEGAITCISINPHPSNQRQLIISAGSSIGSISFHMLKQTDFSQGRVLFAVEFLDYRVDLLSRPVIQLSGLQASTFVTVVYEEGLVALYDSLRGTLLGQFNLYIGMMARQTPSDVAYLQEMESGKGIKHEPLPSLQQLNDSRPHRTHKLAVSIYSPTYFANLFSHNIVSSYCNGRLYIIYMKSGSKLCLARFNTQDVLTICYAGLEACKNICNSDDSSVIDWNVYSSLADDELDNPSMALLKFNQQVSTDVDNSGKATKGGKTTTQGSRRSRTNSNATSLGTEPVTAALNASQFALTEKRLHDHDFSTSHPQFSTMFEKVKARLALRGSISNQFSVTLDQAALVFDSDRRKLGAKNIVNTTTLCDVSMQKSRESRKQRSVKSKKILGDILTLLSKE